MMPVIRISNTTWERLKVHARPLEDSAEDVVRRALDALDAKSGKQIPVPDISEEPSIPASRSGATKVQNKLPQKELRAPIIEVLTELGGRAMVAEIRRRLEPKIASRLSGADYKPVSNGDPRWWNAACWERNELVKEGKLRHDSRRGVWELAD